MKPKFIRVYDRDGRPMLINVNYIEAVRYDDEEECICIDTASDNYYSTLSSLENIEKFINNVYC